MSIVSVTLLRRGSQLGDVNDVVLIVNSDDCLHKIKVDDALGLYHGIISEELELLVPQIAIDLL